MLCGCKMTKLRSQKKGVDAFFFVKTTSHICNVIPFQPNWWEGRSFSCMDCLDQVLLRSTLILFLSICCGTSARSAPRSQWECQLLLKHHQEFEFVVLLLVVAHQSHRDYVFPPKKVSVKKKSDVVNCEKTGVVVSKVNFTLVWRYFDKLPLPLRFFCLSALARALD